MMKKRPDLLSPFIIFYVYVGLTTRPEPSLFALKCASLQGRLYKGPGSPPLPSSLTFSDSWMTSNFSAVTLASEATVVSQHSPDAYERTYYYNRITGSDDCPELLYRSDTLTTSFPKPVGKSGQVPIKSVHGVFDTPLQKVWDTVGPQICDIMQVHEVKWASIDVDTHCPPGDEENGSPVVIWIGVQPASTSADTAHVVSQLILALLQKNGVESVVVEWTEAVVQRLGGPSLL